MRDLRQLSMAVALALATLAAAALISACGGGGDDGEPDARRAATTTADSTHVEAVSKGKTGEETPPDRGPRQTRSKSRGEKDATKPAAGSTDNRRGDATPPKQPQRVGSGSCSTSEDGQGCAEVGAAYEQAKKEGPRVVAADECPPAMTADQCAEAGRAHQEAEGEGQIVPPDECPPAMTDQQCEEAGRAYQEALR